MEKLPMSSLVIIFLIVAFVLVAIFRLYPQRKRLQEEFGDDKPVSFFLDLAKKGHTASRRLIKETQIFITVGVVGAAAMELSKYF